MRVMEKVLKQNGMVMVRVKEKSIQESFWSKARSLLRKLPSKITITSEPEAVKPLIATILQNDRREKISERMNVLQDLVPGCNKVIGKVLVLDEIINNIQSLQRQVEFLSMKLEALKNGREDVTSVLVDAGAMLDFDDSDNIHETQATTMLESRTAKDRFEELKDKIRICIKRDKGGVLDKTSGGETTKIKGFEI